MRRLKQVQITTDTMVAATPTEEVVFNKKNQSIVAI